MNQQHDNGFGLAIETSGRDGSVAAVRGGRVVDERTFPHGLAHAAGLIQLIDDVVRAQGKTPRDVGRFYVSVGPGSFTGLRIGVTAVKTIAMVTGARIVPVPTPLVLAMNAPAEACHVIIVLDAKRGQIFTARYERAGVGWIEQEPPRLASLAVALGTSPRPVHLIGEGIPYHEPFLPVDRDGIIITPRPLWRARAAAVAELGLERGNSGLFVEPDQLVPVYIRRPEAEEKWDANHRSEDPSRSK
jgi:tRNA threonylcarbamoyladenosine biosynthesis protein TsaB